jgi:putative nucleotidyltransferase with HDIG domain
MAPDLPTIIVSGTISEDAAVITMAAGAVDYVLKDNLTRLIPAVRGAIETAELRHQNLRAIDVLRRLAEHYERAQEVGHVGNWEYDPKTAHFWGSIEAKRIFGFDREQTAFTIDEVEGCTPERERVHLALANLIQEGKEFNLEYKIIPKDSSVAKVIWSVAEVHRDERGAPLTVTGVVQDITRRAQAEDALRDSEKRYRSLFEDSPVALWESDHSAVKVHLEQLAATGIDDVIAFLLKNPQEYDHCIELIRPLKANREAVRLSGAQSREELLTRNRSLFGPVAKRGMHLFWTAMLAGEPSATFETTNLSLTGEAFDVLETCTVVPGHEQTYDLVYVADVDISARKEAAKAVYRSAEQLRRTVEGTVLAMGHLVEVRDPYTAGHERHVAELAVAIAAEMGMTAEQQDSLRLAALIHDIGKISIPAEILTKPGRLSALEFSLIKQHSQSGYDIIRTIEFQQPIAQLVLQHHERLDGSGYPRQLAGEDILPAARILAVADVVDAMSSHRPYRPALGAGAALAEIGANAGRTFDADVAAACERVFAAGFAFSD